MRGFSNRRTFSHLVLLVLLAVALLAIASTVLACSKETATSRSSLASRSPLYGKTALFCGDSICAGNPREPEEKRGWAGRIGATYGMHVTNNGRAAATVAISTDRSHGRKPENRIISQIEAAKGNTYDYVILHGGVNDAMDSLPVGTVGDSFDVSSFDTSTFAGALEELFARAKEYFGDKAKIGYIVNYQTPMSNWGGATRDMSAYVKVALQICDKWDIACLDLYDDVQFNQEVMKVSTKENLLDYLHPNESGYDLLAAKIGAWMETMGQSDGGFLPWIIAAVVVVLAVVGIVMVLVVKKKGAQPEEGEVQ